MSDKVEPCLEGTIECPKCNAPLTYAVDILLCEKCDSSFHPIAADVVHKAGGLNE